MSSISKRPHNVLDALIALAEREKCRGNIPGEPELPEAFAHVTVDQMAHLAVMMGFPDRLESCLTLGVDNIPTLKKLAKALGHPQIETMLDEYDANLTIRRRPSI